jgi:predicted peroxiredoxin
MMKVLLIYMVMMFGNHAFADEPEHFVVLTSEDAETQMMVMVLATQSVNKDVPVSVLLCSSAGLMAIKGEESPTFAPPNRSPKQLLVSLIERGVEVNVCGIFLPNRNFSQTDLLDGVGVASPPDIAEHMRKPNVRFFTF